MTDLVVDIKDLTVKIGGKTILVTENPRKMMAFGAAFVGIFAGPPT